MGREASRLSMSGTHRKLFKKKIQPEDQGRIYVFFSLGDEAYAVGIDRAREILKPKDITEIPHTPDYLCGVVNLRGKIVPVVDLRRRFGMPRAQFTKASRIIIVHYGQQDIGLLVDAVTSVQVIPDTHIDSAPEMLSSAIAADYINSIANLDGVIVIIIDLDRALKKPGGKSATAIAQVRP